MTGPTSVASSESRSQGPSHKKRKVPSGAVSSPADTQAEDAFEEADADAPEAQISIWKDKVIQKDRKLYEQRNIIVDCDAQLIEEKKMNIGLKAAIIKLNGQLLEKDDKVLEKEADILGLKKKLASKAKQVVDLQERLVKKDGEIAMTNGMLNEKDAAILRAEGSILGYQEIARHKEKTMEVFESENRQLRKEVQGLKAAERYLTGPEAPMARPKRLRSPTLVPDANPVVRNNPKHPYGHPEAPRDAKMFRYFKPEAIDYPSGAGKVWPSRYGSNAAWDLGLCQEYFHTALPCRFGGRCEFRHEPLSNDERVYITFLTPAGPKFLQTSDSFIANK
jgi:hypothetical protein